MGSDELTGLLQAWKSGDEQVLEQLMPLVYSELRRVANHQLRQERPGHTLQPTALIHEAYLRMAGGEQPKWENRVHFYAIASRIMRQVLVEWARRRQAEKRGGAGAIVMQFDESFMLPVGNQPELIALDDALNALAKFDERGCQAIEMKYFGGLTVEEIASQLKVSVSTVVRTMRSAEAWLRTVAGVLANRPPT